MPRFLLQFKNVKLKVDWSQSLPVAKVLLSTNRYVTQNDVVRGLGIKGAQRNVGGFAHLLPPQVRELVRSHLTRYHERIYNELRQLLGEIPISHRVEYSAAAKKIGVDKEVLHKQKTWNLILKAKANFVSYYSSFACTKCNNTPLRLELVQIRTSSAQLFCSRCGTRNYVSIADAALQKEEGL